MTRRCSNTEAAEEGGNENTVQIELTTTADPGGDDNIEFATHDDDEWDNDQQQNDETVMLLFVPPAQASPELMSWLIREIANVHAIHYVHS